MINIYVLQHGRNGSGAPEGTSTIEWTDIPEIKAHKRGSFVYIDYRTSRNVGRWGIAEKKRAYTVRIMHVGKVASRDWSNHYTFEAAMKAAKQAAAYVAEEEAARKAASKIIEGN